MAITRASTRSVVFRPVAVVLTSPLVGHTYLEGGVICSVADPSMNYFNTDSQSSLYEMWCAITGRQKTSHNCYGSPGSEACKSFWKDTPGKEVISIPMNAINGNGQ